MRYKRIHDRNHHKKNHPYAVGDHKDDFDTDKESSKKWMESHRLSLDKNLTPAQRESITNLHTPGKDYDLNKVLKETGGRIASLPSIDNDGEKDPSRESLIKLYEDDIKNINKAFNHLSGKIPGRMYVYKELDMLDFGYDVPISQVGNDNNITKNFQENYKHGLLSEYLEVNPYYDKKNLNIDNTRRVLLRLSLPKGTNVIPANNETLYLPRNSGLNITEMTFRLLNGQDVLQIEADFVSEEEVKNQITVKQNEINKLWNSKLNLPNNYKLFEFRMSDKYAFGALAHMKTAIDEIIETESVFNTKFAEIITHFIMERNGKIIFTDMLLGYIEEMQYIPSPTPENIEKFNKDNGLTNYNNCTIAINGQAFKEKEKNYHELSRFAYHEMTHIADFKLGLKYYGGGKFSEQNDTFLELYRNEKDNLTGSFFDYAKSKPAEYFAEVHSFMYSTQYIYGKKLSDIVSEQIPETEIFIYDLISKALV
ncbi:ADP-ribosyltransferase [Bacillus toyonensis]|uniref:ADP-ribosyltransferase n=1 Tax=Bacillus toyonensis TaxID=155322 RepID=UPI00321B1937